MELPVTQPVLIVAIAMAIFLLAPLVSERMRLPGIVGIIVAGAIIGPNALNLLERGSTIILLGTVGLLYLMFMAGVEVDLHGFKRYRNRGITFGALTFLLPQILGTAAILALGYGWATSILVASMFASHTLIAYPIAVRFGIARNQAVTTAVGGTIITDTAALLVLAVVAASTRGDLDVAFWMRLVVLFVAYVAAVWFGLPRIARWFFRHERTGVGTDYLFVMLSLFAGSYLALLAGVEPIVGAFLVGLTLNRLIPEHSLLYHRTRFFGESFFIPFFLLSVGMLVDARVMFGSTRAWTVMIVMTVMVTLTKWLAAKTTQRLFHYTPEEGWTIFGLSVAQAAATLAAALVGREVGLVDDAVLNGVILMILVTAIMGPLVVERYGRLVALQEEKNPYQAAQAPQRILVPMAKPASAMALMELALAIREPDSDEPILPLTVVPADENRAAEYVALAERMLSHAVSHATAANVPVMPLTRVDHNFASGIARGMAETRTSIVVIGWDGRRYSPRGIFGSVLDQLLEQTRQMIMVAKLGHPLNTTERIIVLVPFASDHVPGFLQAARVLKLMTSRLGATLHVLTVGAPAAAYEEQFARIRPVAPLSVESAPDWRAAVEHLQGLVRSDDLVIVLSARPGAISWTPVLERLPARLAELLPESFVMLYLGEVAPERAEVSSGALLSGALARERVLIGMPSSSSADVLRDLLAPTFAEQPERAEEIAALLGSAHAEAAARVAPDVVVLHARVPALPEAMLFLATSPDGVELPHDRTNAHLLFVLLTPEKEAGEHYRQLGAIARLVNDPERTAALVNASSHGELEQVIREAVSSVEMLN